MKYKPTIGLEIHAEVRTESKLFCGCPNDPHKGEINAHVCPVCLGYPGAMPYIQKDAIEQVLLLGVALQGTLATYTQFDRKHYFYPDIPKGFQISQHNYPLVSNGSLCDIAITRIHLEEDTAKSSPGSEENTMLLDFNRAGVPLLELVTEPVIHTAEQAVYFAQEFQRILQLLGVSNARMEQGEMRVEANISLSDSDVLGTKVEIKNLNSFKVVQKAIEYEIQRQAALLAKGGSVAQETRGYNEAKGETYTQRKKETQEEYRYAPEPDLPPLDISLVPEWSIEVLSARVPELPEATRKRYMALGISEEQAFTITGIPHRQSFFEEILTMTDSQDSIRLSANYITSDLVSFEQKEGARVYTTLDATLFLELIHLIHTNKVSSRGAKNILAIMVEKGGSPLEIAEAHNLFQQSDEGVLKRIAEGIIQEYPEVVEDYAQGKEASVQFFVGHIMKETKGSANPKVAQEVVKALLQT